jgi:hypothetical protein
MQTRQSHVVRLLEILVMMPHYFANGSKIVGAHIINVTRSNRCRFNPRACSLHSGRLSCLESIKDILLRFIFEKREQGIPVSIKTVVEVAKSYDTSLKGKSYAAQDQAVRRFVDSHGFVHRAHTHQSQKSVALMQVEALTWMGKVRPSISDSNSDQRFVITWTRHRYSFACYPGRRCARISH